MQEAFKKFIHALKPSTHVIFLAHRDPDFDTLSACAALGLIAKKNGCSVELVIPNTEEVCLDYFPFLIQSATYSKKPDLLVICDTSNLDRVYFPAEFQGVDLALFDHHQGGNIPATFKHVDNTAPSCCDLIADILYTYDKTLLTPEISQLLLDGLVADTLSFRTSGVQPTTFNRAAKLLEHGAKPLTTHHRLTQKQTPEDFIFKTQLMSRVQIDNDASCAYVFITEQELAAAGRTKGALEGMGNEMLSGMFINTTALVYTANNGQTKVSLRSNTSNMYEIARQNGGGGHIAAAGFTTDKKPQEIMSELLAQLTKEQQEKQK